MNFWKIIGEFFGQSAFVGFFQHFGWLNLIMIVVACVLLFLAIKKDFEPYLLLPIAFGMLLVNIPLAGSEIFAKGATTYNAISLAAKAGLIPEQSGYIFEQAVALGYIKEGATSITTSQIHQVVMNQDVNFLSNAPATLGFNANIVANLEDIYTHDYSGMFGFLYYGVKWGIYPCLIFLCIGATTDFGPLIANKKTKLLGAAAQIGIFITFIGAIAIAPKTAWPKRHHL